MIEITKWLPDSNRVFIRPLEVSIVKIEGLKVYMRCDGAEYTLTMKDQKDIDDFLGIII